MRRETKLFYVEAITNPTTPVPDFGSITAFARKNGLLTVIDSTFATPVNFRPATLGFDIIIHSCSKYLAGHSDLVAGAIAGGAELVDQIKLCSNHLGGCLDRHARYILHRSLKTLPLRMGRHNSNAMTIAQRLEARPGVGRVYYPGLESHPNHDAAKLYFEGSGGVVTFEMANGESAAKLVDRTQLFIHAGSLRGVKSFVCRPSATSHLALSETQQRAAGIRPELTRPSVGIEDVEDLIADLDQAIAFASG